MICEYDVSVDLDYPDIRMLSSVNQDYPLSVSNEKADPKACSNAIHAILSLPPSLSFWALVLVPLSQQPSAFSFSPVRLVSLSSSVEWWRLFSLFSFFPETSPRAAPCPRISACRCKTDGSCCTVPPGFLSWLSQR